MPAILNTPRIDALRSAPLDLWVALSEDECRIVVSDATDEEVAKKSEEAGVFDPVIVKTHKSLLPFSV